MNYTVYEQINDEKPFIIGYTGTRLDAIELINGDKKNFLEGFDKSIQKVTRNGNEIRVDFHPDCTPAWFVKWFYKETGR